MFTCIFYGFCSWMWFSRWWFECVCSGLWFTAIVSINFPQNGFLQTKNLGRFYLPIVKQKPVIWEIYPRLTGKGWSWTCLIRISCFLVVFNLGIRSVSHLSEASFGLNLSFFPNGVPDGGYFKWFSLLLPFNLTCRKCCLLFLNDVVCP